MMLMVEIKLGSLRSKSALTTRIQPIESNTAWVPSYLKNDIFVDYFVHSNYQLAFLVNMVKFYYKVPIFSDY